MKMTPCLVYPSQESTYKTKQRYIRTAQERDAKYNSCRVCSKPVRMGRYSKHLMNVHKTKVPCANCGIKLHPDLSLKDHKARCLKKRAGQRKTYIEDTGTDVEVEEVEEEVQKEEGERVKQRCDKPVPSRNSSSELARLGYVTVYCVIVRSGDMSPPTHP